MVLHDKLAGARGAGGARAEGDASVGGVVDAEAAGPGVAGGGGRGRVEAAELVGGRGAVVPRRTSVAGAVASARVRAQIKTVPDTTLSSGEREQQS